MNIRLLSGLACLLALAGCASKVFVYAPAPGASTATIRVAERVPFVYLADHAGCPKKMIDQSLTETVIPANTRMWIEPGHSSLGLAYGRECTVPMSFVAEPGKAYVLIFQDRGNSCTANVLERDQNGKLTKNMSSRTEKFERCMY